MATKNEVLTTLEVNHEIGEIVERPLTANEVLYYKDLAEQQKQRELEIANKVAARQSALDKLAALGLTAEEIAAL